MSERFLGYVLERKQNANPESPDHALIKIIARKENGIFKKLTDKQSQTYCPPRGEIFAPNFFASKNNGFNAAAFVELSIRPAEQKEEQNISHPEHTDYIIDYAYLPRQVSLTLLLPYPQVSGILRDGYCNPAEIKTVIDTEIFENQASTFFLYDKTQVAVKSEHTPATYTVIGVFKYDSADHTIAPKTGKEVQTYTISDEQIIRGKNGAEYILPEEHQLQKNDKIIDCMTDDQLSAWFNTKIKDYIQVGGNISKETWDTLCSFPEYESARDNVNAARLNRIKQKIETIQCNAEDIALFLWQQREYIDGQLEETVKAEIRRQYEAEAAAQRQAAQEELKQHHIEIDSAKKHLQDLQERHEELNNRCSEKQHKLGTLTEQYQTILETLRVKIALSQPGTEDIRPDTKYIQRNTEDSQRHTEYVQQQAETTALTIIDFPAEGTPYKEWTADNKTIPVFLHERYQNGNELLTQILCSIRYWWQFKALFVPSAAWVYTLAKIFGNTAVYTLHIEYNWLHFSDFCRNGLQEALNEAYTHPEKNYMLILEGLNCTQPECGLRPLLNVIAGIEPVISGINKPLPKNIQLFATLQPTKDEHPIGLPLHPDLFQNWGAIGSPKEETDRLTLPDDFLDFDPSEDGRLSGYIEPDDVRSIQDAIQSENGNGGGQEHLTALQPYFEY